MYFQEFSLHLHRQTLEPCITQGNMLPNGTPGGKETCVGMVEVRLVFLHHLEGLVVPPPINVRKV